MHLCVNVSTLSPEPWSNQHLLPDTNGCTGEEMGAAEHRNSNLQVLSCLASGNVEIGRIGPGSKLVCSDFSWLAVVMGLHGRLWLTRQ